MLSHSARRRPATITDRRVVGELVDTVWDDDLGHLVRTSSTGTLVACPRGDMGAR